MNIFFWKNNRQIDNFAHGLADELFSGFREDDIDAYFSREIKASTKASHSKTKTSKSTQEVERRINNLVLRIQQFNLEQRLGVYGKARLSLAFMQRLKELGFSQDVIEKLNKTILLRCA